MNEPAIDRALLRKMGIGVVVLLAVAAGLAFALEEPITTMATAFVDTFGMAGIFAAVVITDASPLPMTHEPILLIGVSADVAPMVLWGVAAAASVTAGLVGYGGGALVSRTRVRAWIHTKHPGFETFMSKHGVKGVAVAALLPIPFALATWSAGMTRISLPGTMAAALLRIPKTGFYLWLIVTGWGFGA
ncbi:MAG: hypothetical protein GY898_04305 [Proteobacteria bacterium]|nr:hypothetical protein [Pseudomonadota bacterium]